MSDLIDQDLGNQHIELNNDMNPKGSSEGRMSNVSSSTSGTKDNNNKAQDGRIVDVNQMITSKFTNKAKDQVMKSWIDRYLCCFNWLKGYFKITTKDFFSRLLLSIIPFNSKFYPSIEHSPDFYGPFWIYTTFIVLVSSCGSLTRTIQGKRDTNFFQEFIPTAAVLIYFIGFGVPIFLSLLSKLFGAKINVASVICVYGYSYTIFLPIIIVCSLPNQLLQWILLAYAIFSSTSLIIMSIAKSFDSVGTGKKFGVIIIICIFQLVIFLVLKLYFFKHLNKELLDENTEDTALSSLINDTIVNITNTQGAGNGKK